MSIEANIAVLNPHMTDCFGQFKSRVSQGKITPGELKKLNGIVIVRASVVMVTE